VFCCEVLYALFFQVDRTKGLGILRLQVIYDVVKAGADAVLLLGRQPGGGFQFACPRFEGFVFCSAPAITINHCVPEQAIKPHDRRFTRLKLVLVLESAKICDLQNVFCQLDVQDAALYKREKLFTLGEKLIEESFGHETPDLGGLRAPDRFDVQMLAANLAGADNTFAIRATGAVLAFHGFLLLTA
jgi:hypothetical protein